MRQLRFVRVTSALAAAVVLGVFLFTPMTPRVEAATILRSLRDTLWPGATVVLDNVVIDGIHVAGTVELMFSEPVSLPRLLEGGAAEPSVEEVFFEMAVSAPDDHADADVAGLDVETAGLLRDENPWVFARIVHLPPAILDEAPAIMLFTPVLRNGIWLDLSGMLDAPFGGGPNRQVRNSADGQPAHVVVDVQSRSDVDESETDVHGSFSLGGAGADFPLVARLLRGELAPADFHELVAELEQHVGKAELVRVAPQLWELHLAELSDLDPELASASIVVTFREGAGVEKLDIYNIGELGGSIHVALTDTVGARAAAVTQRLTEEGLTLIRVSDLVSMFGNGSSN